MRAVEDDLRRLAEKAACDEAMIDYLQARRTISVGLMANIAQDYAELDKVLFSPLEAGLEINGKTHKVTADDAPIAKAGPRYLWKLCCDQIALPSQPTSTAPPTPSGSGPSSSATKSPPKELPADAMRDLLRYYEEAAVHGENRAFPQRMLLGAEKVVARVYYEIQQKSFTPLGLHEILCQHLYDASGNVNALAQTDPKGSNKVVLDMAANSVQMAESPSWSPKGVLSMLDALDGVFWCWVLTKMSHEVHIAAYVQWWRQLVRAQANKIDQVKAYWSEASWKMCLEMRQGRSFEEMAKNIMSDSAALQMALQREQPAAPKLKPKPPASTSTRPHQFGREKEPQSDQRRQGDYRRYGGGEKRWSSRNDTWQPQQYRRPDHYDGNKGSQPYQKPGGNAPAG